MKRVELKRMAECFWKSSKEDEKKPFAHQAPPVPDSGSIERTCLQLEDSLKLGKEDQEPLSPARKICFALSFNVWLLYFLLLGYIIPCRDSNCGRIFTAGVAEKNFSGIWLLTNLETYNFRSHPSMLLLGYAEGPSLNLGAIDAATDVLGWNSSLDFIPRRVQCGFEFVFDANGDGVPDCLLTGYNDVYAFNATNGHKFWSLNLPSDDGYIVSRLHPTRGATYLIGTCGVKLVVIDSRLGTKVTETDIPCWSPFDVRLTPNQAQFNLTSWAIVCDYGDKVEAWSFEVEDLLSVKNENNSGSEIFSPFFRRESFSGGSIDLGCDVISIPDGPLLLSWSDRVAMVASTTTVWERIFPYPLTVAGIQSGYFTSSKKLQVAAAVRNVSSSVIYILDMANGSTVDSVHLEDENVQDLSGISSDPLDYLVVKSIHRRNFTSYDSYNLTDPIAIDEYNFVLVEFAQKDFIVRTIATSPAVIGSAVNSKLDGGDDLVLLKAQGSDLAYQKYVIHSAGVGCPASNHASHFFSEM